MKTKKLNDRKRSTCVLVVVVLDRHLECGKDAQDGGGDELDYDRKRGGATARRKRQS